MATLEARSYQDTRDALARNPLMQWLLTMDEQATEILIMDDSELEAEGIARRDSETGKMSPTSGFMNAVNDRFRWLESVNPAHKFTGPMHIGAVAEVMLAARVSLDKQRRELLPHLAERAGRTCFRLDPNAGVRAVADAFEAMLDASA